jgi:hypothetical protein
MANMSNRFLMDNIRAHWAAREAESRGWAVGSWRDDAELVESILPDPLEEIEADWPIHVNASLALYPLGARMLHAAPTGNDSWD